MGKPILINGASSPQDTLELSTTRHHEPGTRGYLSGGRVYYYCQSGTSATVTAGLTCSTAAIVANHQNLATTTAAFAVGQTVIPTGTITLGATAATENQYQFGWLAVVDGGGEGRAYRIREHSAGTSAGTDLVIVLDDPIRVASDANTEVTLVLNPYVNPVLSATTDVDTILGVPNVDVTTGATTTQYFWAQSNGICPMFVIGTPAVGATIIRGTTQGQGIVQDIVEGTATLDISPVIGTMATVGINGEVQLVNLNLRGL